MNIILQLFLKHSTKYWIYILLMLFSLFTAGAGLSSVLIINQAALKALQPQPITPAYIIEAHENASLTLEHYAQLRQAGFIDSLAVAKKSIKVNGETLTIVGIDFFPLMNNRLNYALQNAEQQATQGFSTATISQRALALLQLQEGDSYVLPNGLKTPPLAVQSASNRWLENNYEFAIQLALADFITLHNNKNNIVVEQLIILTKRDPKALQLLTSLFENVATVTTVIDAQDNLEMGKSFSFHLVAMGALMTIVSLFIVTNALSMLMAYRHSTISNLHKLGISRKKITLSLLGELVIYCLLGTGLGVLFGFWAMTSFDTGISSTLSNLLRAPFSLNSVSFSSVALLCLGLSAMGMAVAAILPIRRALQLDSKQDNRRLNKIWLTMLIASGLVLALALFQLKTKLGDLAGLGLLILFFSLLMTLFLPVLFTFAAHKINSQNAMLHWALNSANKLASRCKLSASAYFIALACAIGLSGMVDSFRQATDNWLSQRLAAPAYIYTQSPDSLPLIDNATLLYRITANASFDNRSIALNDYPTTPEYTRAMVFASAIPDVWKKFAAGEAMLVNQQFALRNQIKLNDVHPLNINNSVQDMRVAGIFYDYGNPRGQGLVASEVLKGKGEIGNVVAVHPLLDNMDWDLVQHKLEGANQGHAFITKQDLLTLSMQTFDKTFALTDLLTLVALLVAAISFAITIGLLSRHLSVNIHTLSALGVSFSDIRRAVFYQFALICLIVTLCAIPVGLGFAYLLITTVNVNAFGWTYPLAISIPNLATTTATGFGLMIIVCWVALRRTSNKQTPSGFNALCTAAFCVLLVGCSPPPRETIFANVDTATPSQSFEQVNANRPIILPEDHASHPQYQLEWWYLTSVLRDKDNTPYPLQYTLFRFNQNGQQRYMAHASLHSPEQHWFEERFAESGLPYVNIDASPFALKLDDWAWQGTSQGQPFPAQLQVNWWQGPKLEMHLSPEGPYVFHGENGVSVKSADSQHVSYYYSQPFLRASATLTINGVSKHLTGNAWYDHEWTSQLVTQKVEGWDWFSLHLQSGDKIMVFRLRIEDTNDFFTGSFISPQGEVLTLKQEDFELRPTGKDKIPLNWTLTIPSKNVSVKVSPFKTDQWNCGTFVYYEGGMKVEGTHAGEGFMELTGYPRAESSC